MSYEGRGGRGPCALGGAPRRRREAARDAAPHLFRGTNDRRARRRRLEVGLEEEVEERRRALEVDEEERHGELDVERHPVTYRQELMERRQDEVEQEVLAVRGRRFVGGSTGVRGEDDRVSPSARRSASRSGSGATSSSPRRARTRATTARATSSTTASRSSSAPRSSRAARPTSRAARSSATSASRARSRSLAATASFPGNN